MLAQESGGKNIHLLGVFKVVPIIEQKWILENRNQFPDKYYVDRKQERKKKGGRKGGRNGGKEGGRKGLVTGLVTVRSL